MMHSQLEMMMMMILTKISLDKTSLIRVIAMQITTNFTNYAHTIQQQQQQQQQEYDFTLYTHESKVLQYPLENIFQIHLLLMFLH